MKSHMHFIGSSRHGGFTLIELMVVVAIIAVLAAILFPVFGRARDKAFQTSCINNQKSLALATLMYVQDHDEIFPSHKSWSKDIEVAAKAFDCPASTNDGTIDNPDYSYNRNLSGTPLGNLVTEANTEITIDGLGLTDDGTSSVRSMLAGDFRHSGSIVASYADGHVQLVKYTQIGASRVYAPCALGLTDNVVVNCNEYEDEEELRDALTKLLLNHESSVPALPRVMRPLGGRLLEGKWILDAFTPPQASIDKWNADIPAGSRPSAGTRVVGDVNFGNATAETHLPAVLGTGPCHFTMDFDITNSQDMYYIKFDSNNQNNGNASSRYTKNSGREGGGYLMPGSTGANGVTGWPDGYDSNSGAKAGNIMLLRNGPAQGAWTKVNGMEPTSVLFGDMGDPTNGINGANPTPQDSFDLDSAQRGKYYRMSDQAFAFTGGVLDFVLQYDPSLGYVKNTAGYPMYASTYYKGLGLPLPLMKLDIQLLTRDGQSYTFAGVIPGHMAITKTDGLRLQLKSRKTSPPSAAAYPRFAINSISLSF